MAENAGLLYTFTPEQQRKVDIAIEQYKNGECISNQLEVQKWLEE